MSPLLVSAERFARVGPAQGLRFLLTASGAHRLQEQRNILDVKDSRGKLLVREMFLRAAAGDSDEGWVHYMYPEPGDIFPTWKSVFVKRVTFPSGKPHIIGSGIYNMRMEKAFIEDVVNRAAEDVKRG